MRKKIDLLSKKTWIYINTVLRYVRRVLYMYIRRRWSRTSVQWQIDIKSLPLGKVTGKCSSGHCPWNDIYICRFAHIVQDFVLGVKNIYTYKYIHINFFGRLLLRMCIDILQMWLLVSSIHFLVNHVVISQLVNLSNYLYI